MCVFCYVYVFVVCYIVSAGCHLHVCIISYSIDELTEVVVRREIGTQTAISGLQNRQDIILSTLV